LKKLIHLIAAARPNFMKIAPLYHALKKETWAKAVIVHTGQHYDLNMSDTFFQDLNLHNPHINLNIRSGTHAEQTGGVMIAYEKILLKNKPDLTVVVGDVNSTVACSIAAVKLGIKVAHLEAGLRSFDRTMPEEINRIITDSISDYLWTPSSDADANLINEGIDPKKIRMVGNIMIDSLVMITPSIRKDKTQEKLGLVNKDYGVVTLHRPSNVDSPAVLSSICNALIRVSDKIILVFPVHPRTAKNLHKFGLYNQLNGAKGILLTEPQSYKSFMNLIFGCKFVITDSGGIQEETTCLHIPCITLRNNTERPVTISNGTNVLGGTTKKEIVKAFEHSMKKTLNNRRKPKYWDGRASERILKILLQAHNKKMNS